MLLSPAEVLAMVMDLGGEALVYKSVGTPTYNATTGAVTTPSANYAFTGVWTEYQREEVDGSIIRPEDAHLVTGSEAFPVTPTLNDQILRGSEVWSIVRISNQPNDPFLDFQVRRQ